MNAGAVLDGVIMALGAGLIGARVAYVALHWPEYAGNPWAAFNIWEGGLSLLGGLCLGTLGLLAVARLHHLPPAIVLDVAAPAALVGQAVGRLGCVSAGCAYGRIVDGGMLPAMSLTDASGAFAMRFPSQIVEAIAEGVLFAVLLALAVRGRHRSGAIAAAFLIGYGALRLAAEPMRGDSVFLAGVAVGSWWAAATLTVGVVWIARLRMSTRRTRLTNVEPHVQGAKDP
jgi:phosphatidylglycerol:prolipoprotein diacylglycerol transferase